jgi:hypothetical protein
MPMMGLSSMPIHTGEPIPQKWDISLSKVPLYLFSQDELLPIDSLL